MTAFTCLACLSMSLALGTCGELCPWFYFLAVLPLGAAAIMLVEET